MAKQFSSWLLLVYITSVAACSLPACSEKIADLGNDSGKEKDAAQPAPAPVYSMGIPIEWGDAGSSGGIAPVRLVDKERIGCIGGARDSVTGTDLGYAAVTSFIVDSGRMYWLSLTGVMLDDDYYLRSCDVSSCAQTLTSSAPFPAEGIQCESFLQGLWMQLSSNQVLWQEVGTGYSLSMANTAADSTISSVTLPIPSLGLPFVSGIPIVDRGFLYAATQQNTLIRCGLLDCFNSLERFAMTPPSGVAPLSTSLVYYSGIVAQDNDYLYLVDMPTDAGGNRLLRVAKDLSASFEVIVPDTQTTSNTFRVHGDTVYWVEHVAMGRLLSCPKSGCVGSPSVLMTGLNNPTGLATDDTSLYVLEPPLTVLSLTRNTLTDAYFFSATVSRPGRILKCPLTGCSDPSVLYTTTDEIELDQMMVDDRFVYFRGNYCSTLSVPDVPSCGFIAALPK